MILSRGELLLGSLGERRGLQRSFWGERELLCGFFLERSGFFLLGTGAAGGCLEGAGV